MKINVTQDVAYQYLVEHNVNLSGIAREMGANPTLVAGCFKRNVDRNGKPRHFTEATRPRLNKALEAFAGKLRQSVVAFGSKETYTNKRNKTYDPGAMPAIKQLSQFFNLTAFLLRVLGWTERKKNTVFSFPAANCYGCISREDVNRINTEILQVAGVLSSYEIVADEDDSSSI